MKLHRVKRKKTDTYLEKELWWDQELQIQTVGRDDTMEDIYHHPYEPTPYCVLERLADSGYIGSEDTMVDYGCGKGRVGCFLHRQLGCDSIGVEFDESIWRQAQENARMIGRVDDLSKQAKGLSFVCTDAAVYEVSCGDRFYFFNPFSVEVLRSVLGRILASYYEDPREIRLFFNYPDDAYVAQLMTQSELIFVDEIDCRDLFDRNDDREKILVFEVCA